MAKEIKPLKCPLCETESLVFKLIQDETNAWYCGECPAVLIEFYNDENTKQLHEHLSVGKSE